MAERRIASEKDVQDMKHLGHELETLHERYGGILRAIGRDDLAHQLGEVAADISYFAEGLPDPG